MTEDKIGYSSSFQLSDGRWEKIWKEISLKDGENDMEKLSELKQTVESFHRKSNPSLYPKGNEPIVSNFIPDVEIKKQSREDEITDCMESINNCETIRNLLMFESKFQRLNDQSLTEAYNNKKKELQ